MTSTRKALSIKEQAVIVNRLDSGVSQAKLAKEYGVSRCQVQNIWKRKDDVLRLNADECFNSDRKRAKTKASNTDHDDAMWQWFKKARENNIPISGPIILAKAKDYATQLNMVDFKASSGWLKRFKERHTIRQLAINGERASVNPETVAEWIPELQKLISSYSSRDIYNMDESGLQFRALPDKTLAAGKDSAAGTKVSKNRLTVVLCCNMEGDFTKPLVIGNSAKPRCFKNVRDISKLPVTWKSNKKAWMTGDLYKTWLTTFNTDMQRQARKVLLFIDNAPAHPVIENLSNVKVVFFPANATSLLQPLDAGIIRTVKAAYRKELLSFVVQRIDENNPIHEIIKAVDVLRAISWIHSAVHAVKATTVQKCFKKCHFDKQSELIDQPAQLPNHSDNVFAALQNLLIEFTEATNDEPIDVDVYLAADDEVVSREPLSDDWDKDIINSVTEGTEPNEEEDDEPPVPIPTVECGLRLCDDLERLFISHGLDLSSLQLTKEALRAELPSARTKQSTLDMFLTQ